MKIEIATNDEWVINLVSKVLEQDIKSIKSGINKTKKKKKLSAIEKVDLFDQIKHMSNLQEALKFYSA
jgi:glycerol-3-phosphate responsive antiterminator